jgi:hypothetical protein
MYVFGYLGPAVRMMIKWVLQQPSKGMGFLNWFSRKLSLVWLVNIVLLPSVCKNCVITVSLTKKRSVQCS